MSRAHCNFKHYVVCTQHAVDTWLCTDLQHEEHRRRGRAAVCVCQKTRSFQQQKIAPIGNDIRQLLPCGIENTVTVNRLTPTLNAFTPECELGGERCTRGLGVEPSSLLLCAINQRLHCIPCFAASKAWKGGNHQEAAARLCMQFAFELSKPSTSNSTWHC